MKKPDYIEIHLPVKKRDYNPAVKRFIKYLTLEIIELRFSNKRYRKSFKYKCVFTEATDWHYAGKTKLKYEYVIQIFKEPEAKK